MVDITAGVFPTTLLLMFFTTPPAFVPKGESKTDQEIKATWALQSTSEILTQNHDMCLSIAQTMIAEFDKVNTVSVRAYCLCPPEESAKCFNSDAKMRVQRLAPVPGTGAVLRIGPGGASVPASVPRAGPATQ
jgi:hypothetical protein